MQTKYNVLGVDVSAITLPIAVDQIADWIARHDRQYVCVRDAHGIMQSMAQPKLRHIHNSAGMVTPDGMPLVWLGRWYGHHHVDRVYGPDLLIAVCERAAREGYRMFFFGGAPGVAERLADRLKNRFSTLQIVGVYTPPFGSFSQEDDERAIASINAAAPDIVWVGLSTPKQEEWMGAHRKALSAPVLIGIGAAFDFVSGIKRQAPRWVQRSGFEWLFRLLTEPRRLARRYIIGHPKFVFHIVQQLLGRRYE
jgi:N-acetylglucosaminyldiphosphoundecaprenol N-acetyl-beta-D-mannosaminyltransferase